MTTRKRKTVFRVMVFGSEQFHSDDELIAYYYLNLLAPALRGIAKVKRGWTYRD